MKHTFQFGPWSIEYLLVDGGRISRLRYNSIDILTLEPNNFKAPESDYGLYETRPVYGYDDCFPSVSECKYPDSDWIVPDHGELCWLPWEVEKNADNLIFKVKSQNLPVHFTRGMKFGTNQLIWSFSVENIGKEIIPFQHVMHPLMPLSAITDVNLPEFGSVLDEIKQKTVSLNDPESVRKFLLSQPPGSTNMLFLQNITEGKMSWEFLKKLRIKASFSKELFPTIGIWWNYDIYPDEDNCRRNECALEPIPGMNSTLSDAFQNKDHLEVYPGELFQWEVLWHIYT